MLYDAPEDIYSVARVVSRDLSRARRGARLPKYPSSTVSLTSSHVLEGGPSEALMLTP